MPELGVYFVKPACNASIAAALMCSGVSKSGSPAPKPQTSIPSAFIAFALLSIESVRGVDHNRLAKFFPNRARRRFCRIGRPEHFANFADGISALINERNTFF